MASSQRTEGCAQVARGGPSAVVDVRHDARHAPAQSELRVAVDVEVDVDVGVVAVHNNVAVEVGVHIILSNGSGS